MGAAAGVPKLFTARYLATSVLGSGRVVPVRVGMEPPLIPLPYPLAEVAETLLPGCSMVMAEWPDLSPEYWRRLERTGVEEIVSELAEISARHGGRPLAFLDYEDLEKGQRSPRVVAAAFLEEKLGVPVPELLDDGHTLHHSALPAQVQPLRPKADAEEDLGWPLKHSDVEAWMGRVPWRFARTTPGNPHEYSLRRRQDERVFFLVLLHIRERGYQQWYDGRVYTAYDVGEYFLWSMQDPVPTTILINRKFRDPEKRARLAEEKTGKSREELGLEIEPTEHREVGGSRAVQPTLTDAVAGTELA